ncbi:MAG: dynamin family protein, partial [Deltaproteobacteria bacterium]|nr:dynamin family protein [Deltaproteobacteria bacterium]
MENYQQAKNELLTICRSLSDWIEQARLLPGVSMEALGQWRRTCQEVERQLSSEIIRVAVVGAIKSGKSTFVNSLLMGDYLMRGAGVITSIVTRIRTGPRLNATLYFKSWDEINEEIVNALVLFPAAGGGFNNDRFDIRNSQQRMALQKTLSALTTDEWITNDTRNINSVLLTCYLKGYETVKEIIGSNTKTLRYSNETFSEHRKFVGNDSLAVYLKDIELEIPTGALDFNIEIADCQGSDSSNPLHITMIQDYLLRAHLLVYVISSRTGLRQGDIKFLAMIKKMRILDNTLFILNCDLSEHESLEELNRLIAQLREELSSIRPNPEIYTISALYNLFKTHNDNLPVKDQRRFEQWEKETELVEVSDRNTVWFETEFRKKVTQDRTALFFINNIERLGVMISAMTHWTRLQEEIFTRDSNSAAEILHKIQQHRIRMDSIRTMIRSTL